MTDAQFNQLREAGELTPRADGCWDPLAAQRLIDALLLGAEPVYVAMHDWCSLAEAAKQLRLNSSQVIEQIRDGRLPRVGRYLLRSGFASILVNLGHVGQPENAVSVDAFAYAQGLRPGELISFLRRSEMPFLQVRGPRGGAQVRLSEADRQAFLERFISFRTLGIETGLSWDALQEELEAEGITPSFGSARVYDRAEIASLLR